MFSSPAVSSHSLFFCNTYAFLHHYTHTYLLKIHPAPSFSPLPLPFLRSNSRHLCASLYLATASHSLPNILIPSHFTSCPPHTLASSRILASLTLVGKGGECALTFVLQRFRCHFCCFLIACQKRRGRHMVQQHHLMFAGKDDRVKDKKCSIF